MTKERQALHPITTDGARNVLSITGSSCYAMTGNGYNDTSGDGYSIGMDRG
ncbi:MAG: hypothetical protein IKH75_11945 [Ruminococcus sp.]|nr:hypothetical protein [Ruminococcus sp.]